MRILIQGPMESETNFLVSAIENPTWQVINNFEFACGKLSRDAICELGVDAGELSRDAICELGVDNGEFGNVELVISRTHIGLVYAALATQAGIEEFHPDVVIIQGTSGAHNPNLKRGDIVIGDSYVNIDAYITEKCAVGEGQGMPDYKFHVFEDFKDGAWVEHSLDDELLYEEYLKNPPIFKIDEKLVEIAKKAIGARLVDASCDGIGSCEGGIGGCEGGIGGCEGGGEALESEKPNKIIVGRIGSGFSWNRMADKILEIREKLGTDVEEMETFAVAKVCEMKGVPCLPIRIVSNSEFSGEEFDETTAIECQKFAIEVALEIEKSYKPKN